MPISIIFHFRIIIYTNKKLQEKHDSYKGERNKNPYYPLEKRELSAILGLWIVWGISGNRKISARSLFSMDESLFSFGNCTSPDHTSLYI